MILSQKAYIAFTHIAASNTACNDVTN